MRKLMAVAWWGAVAGIETPYTIGWPFKVTESCGRFTADHDRCSRIGGQISRFAEVDRIRQLQVLEVGGDGDRFVGPDVIQLAGLEKCDEIHRLGPHIAHVAMDRWYSPGICRAPPLAGSVIGVR